MLVVARLFKYVELNNYPAGEKNVLLLAQCSTSLDGYQIILWSGEKGMHFYLLADVFPKCKVLLLRGYRMMSPMKLLAFSLLCPSSSAAVICYEKQPAELTRTA